MKTIAQLEKENAELRAQIEGAKQPSNDWHAMMYLMFLIIFRKYGSSALVQHEITIGAMPPRMDFLIRLDDIPMELEIFQIFRKFNIIEFKGPDDHLGLPEMCQPIMYFGAAARQIIQAREGTFDDFTITLIREAKPVKLLEELKGYTEDGKGIYLINDWVMNVPLQIIVTGELEGAEYAGIRAISKHPRLEDIKSLIEDSERENDPEIQGYYRDLLNLLAKAVPDVVEDAKRRDPEMAREWMKIFEPEIRAERIEAYFQGLVEGAGMSEADAVVRAAKKFDVSVEYVNEVLHPKMAV